MFQKRKSKNSDNYYERIKELYALVNKAWEVDYTINFDLKNKYEYYIQKEDYEIYNSKLNNIKEKVLDNKLYKELLNGNLQNRITYLENPVYAINFYEFNTLNENSYRSKCLKTRLINDNVDLSLYIKDDNGNPKKFSKHKINFNIKTPS